MLSKAMKLRFDNCEMQAKIIANVQSQKFVTYLNEQAIFQKDVDYSSSIMYEKEKDNNFHILFKRVLLTRNDPKQII